MNDIKKAIETLRKRNPYPERAFPDPGADAWEDFHKVVKAHFGKAGDGFLGAQSRDVWNNCIAELEKILEDEDDE